MNEKIWGKIGLERDQRCPCSSTPCHSNLSILCFEINNIFNNLGNLLFGGGRNAG
jgi:hypothetical protein